tara:strand:- start:330 stop:554 length:225 start_codon:yes stop_codon:yes gene_type:complete
MSNEATTNQVEHYRTKQRQAVITLNEEISAVEEHLKKLTALRDNLQEESAQENYEVPVNESYHKAGYPHTTDKE